ncbi:MAG: hypothetical protein BroJett041_23960 [Candidatus Jettenia caeni]|nr:MAG: hypothetical protein BroJett041_23960 [Candidatus Jettenia caeni]
MSISVNSKLLLLLPLVFALSACTRAKQEVTKVGLSIPAVIESKSKILGKNVSQAPTATQALAHVIINATGQGIQDTILETWDACYDCTNPKPVPNEFNLLIPQGDGRLIQVLAVYVDSIDNSMVFYYGDINVSLNQPAHRFEIPVTDLGGAQKIVSGSVSGRYLTGPGVGPSGLVNMRYYPPGKPPMLIERSHIVNGWFNLFVLSGVNMSYEIDNVMVLFGGPVNAYSPVFNASQQVFRSGKPIHKQNRSWSGTPDWRLSEPEISIAGWFGDATAISSKAVCRDMNSAFTKLVKSNDTSTLLTLSAGPVPDPTVLITAGTSAVKFEGGVNITDATYCQNKTEYIDYIKVSTYRLDGQGKDSVAGFYSPFRKPDNKGVVEIQGSDARSVMGQLLPDINNIQKIALYKKRGMDTNVNMNQVPCGEIESGRVAEWIHAGESVVSDTGAFSISSSVTQLEVTSGVSGALCFYGPSGIYPFGVGIRTDNWNSSGGGGYMTPSGPPAKLSLMKMSAPYTGVQKQDCFGVNIGLLDANNMMTSHSSNITFTLSVSDINGSQAYYSNSSDCSSNQNALSTITLSANQSFTQVYTKSSYVMTLPANLTLATAGSSPLALSDATLSLPIKDYSSKTLKLELSDRLVPGLCYPARIKYINYSSYEYQVSQNTNVALTATNGLQFFSNNSCTTTISTAQIPTSSTFVDLWVKLPSGTASSIINMSVSSGDVADPASANIYMGSGGTTLTYLSIDGPNMIQRDSCNGPYRLVAQNEQHTPFPLNAAQTMILSLSSGLTGAFYTDHTCNTTVSSSFPSGQYIYQFYLKPTMAGSTSIGAAVGGISTSSSSISINGLHHLQLTVDEATPVNNGTCIQVSITPKNFDNTSGSFNSATTVNLNGPFFSQRLAGTCVGAVSSVQWPAYDSSSKIFYVLATNNSSNSGTTNITASAAGVLSANASISVNASPGLSMIDSSAVLNFAVEYVFKLGKALVNYTGISPFTFTQTSGTGTLTGDQYTSVGSGGTFQITDSASTPASYSFSANPVTRTVNYDFTSTLNGFTLSRASSGTYYNASGILTTASVNIARFDHNPDPTSSFAANGLLIEGVSTNYALNSESVESFNQSFTTPTANTTVAPDGTSTADLVAWNSPTYTNMAYVSNTIQSWNPASVYTASVFVKKNTARFVGMKIHQSGSTYSYAGIVVDLDTGNYVIMNDPSGFSSYPAPQPKVGIQKLPNSWYRMWVTYQPINGSSTGDVYLYPVYHGGTVLSPDRDNTVSGSTYFWGLQVETSPTMTSYMATTNLTTTRNADILSVDPTTLATYYTDRGTFKINAQLGAGFQTSNTVLKLCGTSCGSEYLELKINSNGTTQVNSSFSGVANASIMTQYPALIAADNVFGVSYRQIANAINMGVNGEAVSHVSTTTNMPAFGTGSTLYIGNNETQSAPLWMHLKSLEYWPEKLSAPSMASW